MHTEISMIHDFLLVMAFCGICLCQSRWMLISRTLDLTGISPLQFSVMKIWTAIQVLISYIIIYYVISCINLIYHHISAGANHQSTLASELWNMRTRLLKRGEKTFQFSARVLKSLRVMKGEAIGLKQINSIMINQGQCDNDGISIWITCSKAGDKVEGLFHENTWYPAGILAFSFLDKNSMMSFWHMPC